MEWGIIQTKRLPSHSTAREEGCPARQHRSGNMGLFCFGVDFHRHFDSSRSYGALTLTHSRWEGPSGMVSLVTLVFPSPIFLLGAYFTRRHRVQDGCLILTCLICGFHVHIEQLLYRGICNITICNYLYSRVRCVDQHSRPALSPEPQLPISETRSVVRSAAVMVAASLGLGALSSSSEQARETSICLVKEI